MTRAASPSPPKVRLGAVVLVALIHVIAVLALIRAFAPDFTRSAVSSVAAAFNVTITAPPPTPQPSPPAPARAPQAAGAAGAAGRKAEPREVAVPKPRVILASQPAPQVAGQGAAVVSGARDEGAGTGAGGQGAGSGAGTGGNGTGGGAAAKAVKISGEINSTRDYPEATREQRLGDHVVLALTIGTDGRVKRCRVHRASRDAQSDQVTCRLATERFRFRPATDGAGNPVESTYGWRQSWFPPKEKKE